MARAPDLPAEDDYWPELYGRSMPPPPDRAGRILAATVGGGGPSHIQRGRPPTEKQLRFRDRLRSAYWAWLRHGGQPPDPEDWIGNEEVLGDWRAFRDRCLALPEWIVAENQPCQVYNPHPEPDETVTWSGGCVEGKAEGKGELVCRLRGGVDRYEGEMRAGKHHGHGIYLWHTGERYEGEWRSGDRHGRGVDTGADGERYEGGWKDHKRHGWGVLTLPDGLVWRGPFCDGLAHGAGTQISPDGCRIQAEWRAGQPYGQGLATYPDGRRETIEAPRRPGLRIVPLPAG